MSTASANTASDDDGGVAAARRLLEVAHEELEIVRDGDVQQLHGLHQRRDDALASLPSTFSPAARELLEQAVCVQEEVSELLTHSMSVLHGELGLVARGRRLARGYAPVRTPVRALLDRSA
jgi:hypothetical protein